MTVLDSGATLDARRDRFADLIVTSCDRVEPRRDLPAPGISDIDEAYDVQERIFVKRTGPGTLPVGWFASATNASMRGQLGLAEPYAAPWRPGRIVDAPTAPLQIGPLGAALELEVCVEMAEDLPPRAQPYGEEEVMAAVRSVRPGIEVVISCFTDWINQKPLSLIAEGGSEQWLVLGPPVQDWRSLPLASLPVALSIDGKPVATGSSAQVMEGPASVMVWLANHVAQRGGGLRRGQICNTGMCAPVHFAAPGERARADFGPLGVVCLDMAVDSVAFSSKEQE